MITVAAADGVRCELHLTHFPRPTYFELHHIIPQRWQDTVRPTEWDMGKWLAGNTAMRAAFPDAGHSPDHTGLVLWDARTTVCCRTGHGNVHHYIVEMMHLLFGEPALHWAQLRERLRIKEGHLDIASFKMAEEAITRITLACNGPQCLPELWAAAEWGQI